MRRNRLLMPPRQGALGGSPFLTNAALLQMNLVPEGDEPGGGGGGTGTAADDALMRALEALPKEMREGLKRLNELCEKQAPFAERVEALGSTQAALGERLEKVERMLRDGLGGGGDAKPKSRFAEIRRQSTPKENGIRIGMHEEDVRQFSFARAWLATNTGDWSDARFEQMILSDTRNTRENRDARLGLDELKQRALLVTGTGANLLPTELQDFILAPLKEQNPFLQAGARLWENPKGTIEWNLGAAGDLTDRTDGTEIDDDSANYTFTKFSMSAQLFGAMVYVSNQLLKENLPAADDYVVSELRKAISRKLGRVGLERLRLLTPVSDALTKPSAGNPLTQSNFTRAIALIENANVMTSADRMSLITNSLNRWHLLNSDEGAGRPWIPFASAQSLKAATGVESYAYSAMNDDSGITGEAVLGDFDNMVFGLFGDGIELDASRDFKFSTNLMSFRAMLSADCELFYEEPFVYWDALGDGA